MPDGYGEPQMRTVMMMEKKNEKKNSCFGEIFVFIWPLVGHHIVEQNVDW